MERSSEATFFFLLSLLVPLSPVFCKRETLSLSASQNRAEGRPVDEASCYSNQNGGEGERRKSLSSQRCEGRKVGAPTGDCRSAPGPYEYCCGGREASTLGKGHHRAICRHSAIYPLLSLSPTYEHTQNPHTHTLTLVYITLPPDQPLAGFLNDSSQTDSMMMNTRWAV